MPNAVITGGSSGLGLGLARALAARGYRLALLARNQERLQAAAAAIRTQQPGAEVLTAPVDVGDADLLPKVVDDLATRLGGIDVWVNCAGIMREGRFENLGDDVFREVFEINFFGVVNGCRAALPHLRRSRGRLVNIASMGAYVGVYGYSAYASSKHALKGLTEALYYELQPDGIQVRLVCPPEFDSPLVDELETYRSPENRAQTLMIPKEPLEVIVRDTVKAIEGRRYETITGCRARMTAVGLRLFPSLVRCLGRRVIAKARNQG